MTEKTPQESLFDDAAARMLDGFAQRVSRRGVLARLGKLALGLMGLTFVPTLPLDRTFIAEAQSVGCGDWQLCGICGRLCASCCGGGGSLTACPSCTKRGHFGWCKCCLDCNGRWVMFEYWDCCGDEAGAADCEGTTCNNNCSPSIIEWCRDPMNPMRSLGTYRCTVIVNRGSCSCPM